MSDYISKLPDDILCDLLSFLPVRDVVRARSLSLRWKDVPDCRSVLQFDTFSVFGKDVGRQQKHNRDQFVKAVDQFIKKIWEGQKINKYKLDFGLNKEYAAHLDGWIASVTRKGVEELDLNLALYGSAPPNKYVLPCHFLHSDKGKASSYLKHLRLNNCNLILCSGCKGWLSHLTTLELECVTLRVSDVEYILSAGLNLTSLTIDSCGLSKLKLNRFNVRLLCLKKLAIIGDAELDLNCPCLEILKYTSHNQYKITVSHLPLLREVHLKLLSRIEGRSSIFVDHLTNNTPKLQYLNLLVTTEVTPLLASIATHCLKRLHLYLKVPLGFDLLIITDVLHASPFLEALHLEIKYRLESRRSPERQYPDRLHLHLKEFTLEGYYQMLKEIEFAKYLLKNAVALEKMVIVAKDISKWRCEPDLNLFEGIHPTVQPVIL